MATIDEQFVEFVVKSLVNHPDDVKIERTIDDRGVFLQLTVNPEDLGRVIGKRGATAQSIRTLLRALGTKNDARYNFKIIDNGEPREDRLPRSEDGVPTNKVEEAKKEEVEKVTEAETAEAEPQEEAEEKKDETVEVDDFDFDEEEKTGERESLKKRTMDELKDLDDLEV